MIPRFSILQAATLASLALVGCSSSTSTTRTPAAPVKAASAIEIGRLRTALDAESFVARTLYVEGDITLDQNGESNSATFVMRSKRLSETGRIDSLSIEIKGPFGIKVARFLAAPEGYKFYDVLHGETMSGKTDAHALEGLTHLRGLSLAMMSDLAFGLAPGIDAVSAEDSVTLLTSGTLEQLIVRRPEDVSEIIDLESSSHSAASPVLVDRYRRWNGTATDGPPAVAIRFSNRTLLDGFSIPKHIEANAGIDKLTLDYTRIELNPSPITVKIKMPK
ncbi:MAG: DUF4292 domain-containing protein [Bacteroidota bacterium]|nr:DUF4292 domain-containing protein [Bacteroidota bacterium]MDP4233686.1 DUF4292 domain-containing protein [Bacteroidota bacterium]MDP4241857.1 DUF4292 domain-containing protein [Bacteroidota bacterium]MDP4288955.1 DUF4292 domain-containing protein [Bacteroidota bacterium]